MKDPKMTDDEPEPTEDELRAAAELARALDAKTDPAPGTDAAFASALRATRKLVPVASETRVAALDRAMAKGDARARARSRARWLAVAAAALLALGIPAAAAISAGTSGGVTRVPAAYGGRTDALLGSAIDDERTSSERMDVIAAARTRDYFAAWAAVQEGAQ
jgi:hypothetical protein